MSVGQVPPPWLLGAFQGVMLPAEPLLHLPCPGTRHFCPVSIVLSLIWLASVHGLYPLLNKASVTAVLSSYRPDVNVFTQ